MIRFSTLMRSGLNKLFFVLNQCLGGVPSRGTKGVLRSSLASITAGFAIFGLAACASGASSAQQRAPFPGQGQYVYPQYLRPEPTPYIPQSDDCRARLYTGLVGQHIGGVHITAIGGDKRIIKPAELEVDEDDFLMDLRPEPPFLEVTELLAGQPLYAASIRTVPDLNILGPERADRLTIELDAEGYIGAISCS